MYGFLYEGTVGLVPRSPSFRYFTEYPYEPRAQARRAARAVIEPWRIDVIVDGRVRESGRTTDASRAAGLAFLRSLGGAGAHDVMLRMVQPVIGANGMGPTIDSDSFRASDRDLRELMRILWLTA